MVDKSPVKYVYLGSGETPSEIRDDTLYFDPRKRKIYLGSVAYDSANSTIVTFTENLSTGDYTADVAFGDAVNLIGAGQFVFAYFNPDIYVLTGRTSQQLTFTTISSTAVGAITKTFTWTALSISFSTGTINSLPAATTVDAGKILSVDNTGSANKFREALWNRPE